MFSEQVLVTVLLGASLVLPVSYGGGTRFHKDQSTEVEFPPRLARPVQGIPVGHLRPLGFQRRADGKVEESRVLPSDVFYHKYVDSKKAVVFRRAVGDVPAMTSWNSDDYLIEQYGDLEIHVVVKKELFTSGPTKMMLRQFLKEYHHEDWYLSNTVPQEMMYELRLPTLLMCGMRKYLQESEMWMSSGGTASLLHSHADHNLHCVLAGRKDFILIQPKHRHKMSYKPRDPYPGAGYSDIDMDMVNMFEHKEVAEVPWSWSTLFPGDCIFVPAGHLHQVRSYGRSISSTILWAPVRDMHFRDCEKEDDQDKPTRLSEVNFIWTYRDGDRQLMNTRLTARSLKRHLLVLLREEDSLSFQLFKTFFDEITSEMEEHIDVGEVWNLMGVQKNKPLLREAILGFGRSTLENVAHLLNTPIASTRDEL